jgi:hypothetical protein
MNSVIGMKMMLNGYVLLKVVAKDRQDLLGLREPMDCLGQRGQPAHKDQLELTELQDQLDLQG